MPEQEPQTVELPPSQIEKDMNDLVPVLAHGLLRRLDTRGLRGKVRIQAAAGEEWGVAASPQNPAKDIPDVIVYPKEYLEKDKRLVNARLRHEIGNLNYPIEGELPELKAWCEKRHVAPALVTALVETVQESSVNYLEMRNSHSNKPAENFRALYEEEIPAAKIASEIPTQQPYKQALDLTLLYGLTHTGVVPTEVFDTALADAHPSVQNIFDRQTCSLIDQSVKLADPKAKVRFVREYLWTKFSPLVGISTPVEKTSDGKTGEKAASEEAEGDETVESEDKTEKQESNEEGEQGESEDGGEEADSEGEDEGEGSGAGEGEGQGEPGEGEGGGEGNGQGEGEGKGGAGQGQGGEGEGAGSGEADGEGSGAGQSGKGKGSGSAKGQGGSGSGQGAEGNEEIGQSEGQGGGSESSTGQPGKQEGDSHETFQQGGATNERDISSLFEKPDPELVKQILQLERSLQNSFSQTSDGGERKMKSVDETVHQRIAEREILARQRTQEVQKAAIEAVKDDQRRRLEAQYRELSKLDGEALSIYTGYMESMRPFIDDLTEFFVERFHLDREFVEERNKRRGARLQSGFQKNILGSKEGRIAIRPESLERRRAPEKPNIIWTLIIDNSGSCAGEIIEQEKRLAIGLMEVAKKLEIPFELIAFGGEQNFVILKPFDEDVEGDDLQKIVLLQADQGTPDVETLEGACQSMRDFSAKFSRSYNFVYFMTDGQSGSGSIQEVIERHKRDMLLSGIGLASAANTIGDTWGKNALAVPEVKDLNRKFIEKVERQIDETFD